MIYRLPPNVYTMIAAGEVIEKPASCVKELIENSLDAEATSITVKIKDGGKKRCSVADNGTGIMPEDVPIAVNRYTTSKIKTLGDLETLSSYGFRGEALHSISAVSRLTLRTNCNENSDIEGQEFYFEAGELKEEKPVPHHRGTTVIVENLFFNTPARRKFLSSKSKDERDIINTFVTLALSNPMVAFRLENEKGVIYDLPAVDSVRERVENIFGTDFIEETEEYAHSFKRFSIFVFLSKKEHLLQNPPVRHIFVNGRPVYDNRLSAIMNNLFSQREKSPNYIIFMKVDPKEIDFNVHPQKLRVKYSRRINIYWRIQEFLSSEVREKGLISLKAFAGVKYNVLRTIGKIEEMHQMEFGEVEERESPAIGIHPDNINQIDDTFIVAIVPDGILIVDQHTAHEKIIYENLKNNTYSPQSLLFPLILQLNQKQFQKAKELHQELSKFGFALSFLSGNSISIDAVPGYFEKFRKETFLDIIDELLGFKAKRDTDSILKTVACKSACKSGDKLSREEMTVLLGDLLALEDPLFCPHGRPIIIKMSSEELKRRFGR